jgi:heme/copper-type cytochrome/quinol oxidase subunit 3
MRHRLRLSMAMFILSEAIFFAILIGAFVYYRAGLNETPGSAPSRADIIHNPSAVLDRMRTAGFTLFLLASSATMYFAERSANRGNPTILRFWLGATVLLGAAFLAGQASEYLDLLRRNITISRDLFGSTFYTMTGFHGLHVFGGLVALSILLALACWGQPDEPAAVAIDTIALYWHFVDVVWIAIFTLVYVL